MSSDLLDLLNEAPKRLGSLNCPTCGRFARVVMVHPWSYPDNGGYATVWCKDHGSGEV